MSSISALLINAMLTLRRSMVRQLRVPIQYQSTLFSKVLLAGSP